MKITPKLEIEILGKAAEGWSAGKIAAWLATDRKVRVTSQAINARLRQTRVERAEVAKAVTREKLVPHVTGDLDVLSAEQARIERLASRLHARAHAALDTLDASAHRAKGEELDMDALKVAVLTVDSMSELAMKASTQVRALADRKLHYAGADSDDEGDAEVAEAGDRIRSRLAILASNSPKGS